VIKGKWVIIGVLLVALAMGFASWPLMNLRRRNEIHATKGMMEVLLDRCDRYRARNGRYPESLGALDPGVLEYRDAWQRPIQYELSAGKPRLRSLGPNPNDASDDLHR
jgi:hypothetical protein